MKLSLFETPSPIAEDRFHSIMCPPDTLKQCCQFIMGLEQTFCFSSTEKVDAFTPNVKSVLSENLGGILGGTQC
jgi:hypothetical protein